MNDTRHTVNESADKITLKTKLTRGEGTRDQDKVSVKVKGHDAAATASKLRAVLDALDEEGVTDQLRATQPEGDA